MSDGSDVTRASVSPSTPVRDHPPRQRLRPGRAVVPPARRHPPGIHAS
ncbi:hypothetical protein Drose_27675 [Dactylosporangium roseum]|uniref:Uncharacterized protein n=1 Tax=Dactylosporangium roseum TaxID=47989 RepID=A0ABY5YYW0_9ACTN|nr:hypothetical protein [Dactylosporangium roseum]UWZ34931.1 hypothetical protein Drose_27675 [Dactylosporangium roseum]